MKVKLSEPYDFEGKTYKEVELSLESEKLTGKVIKNLVKSWKKTLDPRDEGTRLDFANALQNDDFADYLVAHFLGQPLEFVEDLPIADWLNLRSEVAVFLSSKVSR